MDLGKLTKLSHHRKCMECGAEFETNENETALAQYADHSTIHQPTAGQWTEAYNRIRESQQKKSRE